jgi:hypothetical protein
MNSRCARTALTWDGIENGSFAVTVAGGFGFHGASSFSSSASG